MPAVPVLVGVSLAAQGAGMIMQNSAAKRAQAAANQSADLATATAEHNAAVDIAQAQQLDYNTVANVRNARAEDAVYMSRQATAYASAGVLSSGSPLAVEATTAGRLEQRVQQEWQNSQQQQQQLYSAAKVGQLYGQAQASAYRTQAAGIGLQNMANMFTGGARLLSTSIGAYQSGALNFGGGGSPVGTVEDGGDVAAITTR